MNEAPMVHGPFSISPKLVEESNNEKNITVYSEDELRNIVFPWEVMQTKTVNLTKEAELHKDG